MSTPPIRPMPRRHFGPTEPIVWAFLKPEDDSNQIAELRLWVDWVRWRFTLDHRTIPDCWDRHGPIIEELAALYTAWEAAYTYSNDGTDPLRWMAQFSVARERLHEWVSRTGCRPGEHR